MITELQGVLPNGTFTLSPVSAAHAGTYRCSVTYGRYSLTSAESELLEIIVTGVFTKPSLLARPQSLVPEGGNITLQCLSDIAFDTFTLHQEGGLRYSQQHGEKLGKQHDHSCFSVVLMTSAQAGTYRCYGSSSHAPSEWSAPSEPLDLVITGRHRKPSLSTQMGPEMNSGENLTFFCHSESSFNVFHLFREGKVPGHWFTGVQSGKFQATFALGPLSPTFSGTYRCYGCFNHSPYEWSHPSDPQHLSFTESLTTALSNLEITTRTDVAILNTETEENQMMDGKENHTAIFSTGYDQEAGFCWPLKQCFSRTDWY
ncbi:putative killer cell immunoglobulin-like receptor-like protein KIR3DX1 [Sorex fumeus]|uniref:putative killer cell immunoglobulin-like receptor-like protein KIR3DX1 n=1 Tax=Sorex fumeus TaxID=62283 RepID=UPI0024AD1723|nr:putative killer cell immunoglobulin-like receptor-like protein KIR3DX1 [Sorex fumeus]